jgi:RNA polymerase-binding transcription factor DksA
MTMIVGAPMGHPKLGPEALSEFEDLLRRRKAVLADDVLGLERASAETAENDHPRSTHLADRGTDSFEQDVRLGRMESAGDEIVEIDDALGRLHDGRYGLCEECGRPLPLGRLRAIPYARLCISCKRSEEAA